MYRYVLIALVLTQVSLAEDEPVFSCLENPGRELCFLMREVKSYNVPCEGSACSERFRRVTIALDWFSDFYNRNFLGTENLAWDIANQAYKTADSICRYKISGNKELVSKMNMAENRALRYLKEIQVLAGLPSQRFCVRYLY